MPGSSSTSSSSGRRRPRHRPPPPHPPLTAVGRRPRPDSHQSARSAHNRPHPSSLDAGTLPTNSSFVLPHGQLLSSSSSFPSPQSIGLFFGSPSPNFSMAGGDSSSSTAVVAREGKADRRLRKKQKQQEEEQPAAEEEQKGVNPLNPKLSDYDPKKGKYVYTRFLSYKFDPDLESPVGPMHHTDKIFEEGFLLCNSLNVVSVKIVSSDYGYPLNVYGTVIARDNMDRKCLYIFRRGKDNCQFICSKDDSLILTGPKRGLLICDSIIFEIDLKVKDVHGRKVKDERLSKGLLEVDGIFRLSFEPKYKVQTKTLVSMHSMLDLNYTFVRNAVEGTVEIRILEGPIDFYGKIVARPTSFPCDIVLHDSKLSGMLTAGDNGVVQTARRVVGVSVDEMLLLTVAAAVGGDEFSVRTVEFTPRRNSYDEEKITCGNYKMLLKVTWSIVYF